MKKPILSFLLVVTVLVAFAQTDTDDSYKQYAGAKSLEVQFAPLGGTPISIGGLRFRSFTTANSAWRLNAFLGFNNITNKNNVNDANGDEVTLKNVTSAFTLNISPGIETHFPGTKRLSPYYGVEAILGFRSRTDKAETFDIDGTTVITNKTKNQGNDGYFRLGTNALLGADFYFSKNIYLGTEVGLGLQLTRQFDDVYVPDSGDEVTNSEGGSNFSFGPSAVGQIRLGFLF